MTGSIAAQTAACPVCGNGHVEVLFHRSKVPVLLNRLYDQSDEAKAASTGSLAIAVCHGCSFIFNDQFRQSLVHYDQTYENDQSQSPAFRRHMESVARSILGQFGANEIVEIGCGQGLFLERLVEASGGRISARGFDPAFRRRPLPSQIAIEATVFRGSAVAEGKKPDTVIARHVIEHIPRPVDFLIEIRRSLDSWSDWTLFLETPNVEWILDNLAVHDFFYEHCSYFSEESIETALALAGFATVKVETIFDDQYLLAVAIPQTSRRDVSSHCAHRIRASAERFRDKAPQVELSWAEQVETGSRNGGVAAWGAGAKGISFSSLVDPRGDLLAGIVDISSKKQHRFVPISGLPVLSPVEVASNRVRTVVVMNPIYHAEIKRQLADLDSYPSIVLI
jgi:hypothetical protein